MPPTSPGSRMRARTKLICTLGPATSTPDLVHQLADAGASVFRVNLSHGTPEEQVERVHVVRKVEAERGESLAVMADLPGPKVRLGDLSAPSIRLRAGQAFELRPAGGVGDETGAAISYRELAQDVRVGDRVLLADGAVDLIVKQIDDIWLTEVVRGGLIRPRAGVNVPAERLSLPAITERDRDALARALDLDVDFIAQSFVRSPQDIVELRSMIGERGVPIVAKLETRPAVEACEGIFAVADGIMVARGDLGVEMPMEEIPILQKDLLAAGRLAGLPVVVATQMLESMIRAPRPTRAEASDVANAVLDGADGILLSAETTIGEYPVDAALAATRIAATAEERAGRFRLTGTACRHTGEAAAVAHAAAQVAAGDPEVVAIACFTETGLTANLIAAERPGVPAFAFSPHDAVRRRLCLRWGIRPLPASDPPDTDAMIGLMDEGLRRVGIGDGEAVVMVASSPAGRATTNMLKVHHVGAPVR